MMMMSVCLFACLKCLLTTRCRILVPKWVFSESANLMVSFKLVPIDQCCHVNDDFRVLSPASSEPNFMPFHSQLRLGLSAVAKRNTSSFSLIPRQVSMLWADSNLNRILYRKLLQTTHISQTVTEELFCAGSQAMSTSQTMRGLTLQPNRLLACPLQIWNFQPVTLYTSCFQVQPQRIASWLE